MQFTKCFVMFVAMFEAICVSTIIIKTKNNDGSSKLEEAALKILKNCYEHQDKTVILLGGFPGNLIEKLSSYRSFSVALMDNRQRTETIHESLYYSGPLNRTHKINLVIAVASNKKHTEDLLVMYRESRYFTALASYLVLGWSPQRKHAVCDGKQRIFKYMINFVPQLATNFKMMCHHRTKGIVIHNSNYYTNQIPEPWTLIGIGKSPNNNPDFYMLGQLYRDNATMCKNLDFDKSRNKGGTSIKIILMPGYVPNEQDEITKSTFQPHRWSSIILAKQWFCIKMFLDYVNATAKFVAEEAVLEDLKASRNRDGIQIRPVSLARFYQSNRHYAYPFKTESRSLFTKFRGYKSQLQKIIDVIDIYSWVATYAVYIFTLIFFKFFLRQPLLVGILNLIRLTSNTGLITLPRDLPSQIYLTCVFCFVVTMQGIFLSNLAALLTQDIPVRQVNSLQDLIDLNYTTYIEKLDVAHFAHLEFKGHLVTKLYDDSCFRIVGDNPSRACVYNSIMKVFAPINKFHMSSDYIFTDYYTYIIPHYWELEETFNKFMAIMFAANTLLPLEIMVNEKRLIEFESAEEDPEPRVMIAADLNFAFIILGSGLSMAFITFIAEIIIHLFQCRVKKTRVIVLK